MRRNRTKQTRTFEDRLRTEASRLRERADKLPASIEREMLLKKARQTDTASHISEWLSSAGLRSPV